MSEEDEQQRRQQKLDRVLADLREFARSAAQVIARGREAYFDPEDDLLRRAGRSVIVDISAAVDRLPEDFRARHPDIPWRNIRDTRNYITHQYESVRDDLIWEALRIHIPDLVRRVAQPRLEGDADQGVS